MSEMREPEGTLRVDGATLFYRVRGSGPLLVFLCGGHGDADATDALADLLVDRYTVVTYDRRGLSRSIVDQPAAETSIGAHSDDAHRLLAALSNQPALVFGSSIGALIGLDLAAHHPEQVRVLVAHEPPAWELLSEREGEAAVQLQIDAEEAFRREGIDAAFKKFAVLAAVSYDDREPDVTLRPPTPQIAANLSFFFTYDSPAVRRYRVDLAGLRAASTRVVPALGESSSKSAPHAAAAALAAALGTEAVEFAGGHTAWLLRPKSFAVKLDEILH